MAAAPNEPKLIPGPGELHVWVAKLDPESPVLDPAAASLSLDEYRRAQRFHFEPDRRRYMLGRGYLRAILAQYAGQRPEMLRFGYGPNGKPVLLEPYDGIQFNLSHAGDYALYAVALGLPLGVDLEYQRPGFADALIAEQFFSDRECQELRALPDAEQGAAFFRCWTRKEAFVKANGVGLSFGLQDFDVSLEPDAPCLRAVRKGGEAAAEWSLFSFEPLPNYVAAVAAKSRSARLVFQTQSPDALFIPPIHGRSRVVLPTQL